MSLFDYLEYAASVAVPFEKKTLSSYYTIIRGSGNAVYTEIWSAPPPSKKNEIFSHLEVNYIVKHDTGSSVSDNTVNDLL